MEILKFKTNIKSFEQVAQVTPMLNQLQEISKWQVDPESQDNILSVSGENLNPQSVEDAVQKAGFTAEILRVVGLSGEEL
ncbi:copper chaperone (plasmid) [Adhaeribacter swui]|uniref:Copper chaperone n=1 Tax=Adhaeribacter swui TaxID=2086471 RepID=A0A7G7G2D7_9BACT|nr:copper chaperone [Adhaeribacter swui]QNF31321.1 copper chaperone [Adhaeribacter swui]